MRSLRPLIVFDIDGTLIDSVRVDDEGFIQTYKDLHGIDLGEVDWSTFLHVTDWGLSNSIFEKNRGRLPTEPELESVKAHFLNILIAKSKEDKGLFQEIPGAVDFFHLLKREKFSLAIATGGWEETAMFKLEQIGLDFREIPFANSNHHFSRKEITQHAIDAATSQYGAKFQRIIYFGDGKWDYLNCQEMGIEFIGVDFHQSKKLEALGAQTVIHDFSRPKSLIQFINPD